jgi:hypothetical protein
MKNRLLIIAMLGCIAVNAQSNLKLNYHWMANGSPISLNQIFTNQEGNATKITQFAMYVSNLKVVHTGGQELALDTVIFSNQNAVDIDLGSVNVGVIENLKFSIGVPQNVNHTDISEYKPGHPLSFQSPSMHWGWTSGYFFCIINGMVDTDSDGVPDRVFELNTLGDGNYTNIIKNPTVLTAQNGDRTMHFGVHFDQWLKGISLATIDEAHGEFGVNIVHMQNAVNFPVFQNLPDASIGSDKPFGCSFGCSTNGSNLVLTWQENVDKDLKVIIIDGAGKKVFEDKIADFSGAKSIAIEKGVYYLSVSNGKTILHAKKIINF